jgi:hypothetical protein
MGSRRRVFRSSARGGLGFATVALVLALAPRAGRGAEEAPVALRWTAPPGCPDESAVAALVARMVTVQPKAPTSATIEVVPARGGESGFEVRIELRGGAEGERTLRTSTCASAARGAALVVALAIDPSAATSVEQEPGPPPAPAAPSASASASASGTEPAPAPAAARVDEPPPPRGAAVPAGTSAAPGLQVSATAGASFTRALVPGWVPAITLGGRASWQALRLDLEAEFAPQVTVSADASPGVGGNLRAYALALRPCLLASARLGSVSIGSCVGLRGTRLAGAGTGVTEAYHRGITVLALEPGAALLVPVTILGARRLAFGLDAAAVLPFTRPELVIDTRSTPLSLGRVAALGVRLGISAAFRF